MSPPSKRQARRVLLAAAVTLLIAAILAIAGSGLAPADERSPFATAIVALELARTPADVLAALGTPPGEARTVLGHVVAIDFAFALAYPLLQLAIIAYLTRRTAWRVAAALLALAMAAGDALENVALLAVLRAPATEAAAPPASLELWTTVKWSALFAAALLTAGLLWSRGGIARVLALAPLAAALAGGAGLLLPEHRALVEVAGVYGLGVSWLAVAALAIASLRAPAPARRR